MRENKKAEILRLLRECDGYVSGQELCERFSVSRTAVWKIIQQLREEGYGIEAVQNRGYRLTETPDILSASEIESRLKGGWIGNTVFPIHPPFSRLSISLTPGQSVLRRTERLTERWRRQMCRRPDGAAAAGNGIRQKERISA